MVDQEVIPSIESETIEDRSGPGVAWYAATGVIAAGAAVAISEVVAGLFFSAPSLVVGLGDAVIANTPSVISKWAIRTFGTADKLVLVISILAVTTIFGALLGLAARRRNWVPIVGFAAFGVLAAAAGVDVPLASSGLVLFSAVLAVAVGLSSLRAMQRILNRSGPDPTDWKSSRRSFLAASGAIAVAAVSGAGFGQALTSRAREAAANREEIALPPPQTLAPRAATGPETFDDISGISSLITPNDDFYRIDTALSVPQVNLDSWSVSITGDVGRPYTLNYSDLTAMPMVEQAITIACVSNPVGGGLIGNANWQGVPLRTILEEADVPTTGKQVVGRSVDGFTVGFPIEAVFDGREALIAIGMNGEPLPFEHGFPARLIVSGLYGYVSATKWLSEIEIVDWDAFDAYWIPRGWSKQAPIKTQSRIDTPRRGTIVAGPLTIAGVAWAQNRGVERVEVNVDETGWQEARLPEELSINTWRQWAIDVDLAPGVHQIQVRATDSTGEPQTAELASPAPNGATGYHTIQVLAEAADA